MTSNTSKYLHTYMHTQATCTYVQIHECTTKKALDQRVHYVSIAELVPAEAGQ